MRSVEEHLRLGSALSLGDWGRGEGVEHVARLDDALVLVHGTRRAQLGELLHALRRHLAKFEQVEIIGVRET